MWTLSVEGRRPCTDADFVDKNSRSAQDGIRTYSTKPLERPPQQTLVP